MNINKITVVMIVCLFSIIATTKAQQTARYKSYFANPYLVNPSFAGEGALPKVTILHQNSLVEFTGSPKTTLLTFDKQLKNKKMGLGLFIAKDNVNIIGKTTAKLSYSYKVILKNESYLRFGLSAGVAYQQIDFDKINVQDETETILANNIENRAALDGDFGVSYITKKLTLGGAVNNIFRTNTTFVDGNGNKNLPFKTLRSYFVFGFYDFKINKELKYRPIVSLETTDGLSILSKIGSQIIYRNDYLLGINYSPNSAVGVDLGIKLADNLKLNYAYETTIGKAPLSLSTHEIALSYVFLGKSKKETFYRRQRVETTSVEEIDYLKDDIARLKKTVDSQQQELDRLRESSIRDSSELNDIIRNNIKSNLNNNEDQRTINTEKSSEKTYYIVVSAFKKLSNLKVQQAILKRGEGLETFVIQNKRQSFYFAYLSKYENYEVALSELKKVKANYQKSQFVQGKIWMYTE